MNHYRTSSRALRCFCWRAFDRRHGRQIEAQLRGGGAPRCPLCGDVLEARRTTRYRRQLILDATGFDIDCRGCRRFWCVMRHTPRSLRLLRMRRLLAAVRAAGERGGARRAAAPEPVGFPAVA